MPISLKPVLRVPLATVALLAAVLLGGCWSSAHVSPRELALERTQFVRVSEELREVEDAVHREMRTSRVAWPLIYNGLPARLGPRLQAAVRGASAEVGALPAPRFMTEESTLTGPASGIAGLYEDYDRLAERGWRLTETTVSAIVGANHAVARFVRANSNLYIDAIYDGHFYLSQIGKRLTDSYKKLGGKAAFGEQLPEGEIEALAAAYSIPSVRLQPHPGSATEEH